MLLDKLLRNLAVHVEPFAICEVGTGWRLSLPGPPDVMLHFVLKGQGAIRGSAGERFPITPSCLAVVPSGAGHSLEFGAIIHDELTISAPPSGPPIHRIVAGSPSTSDLVIACGIVHARYGRSLGLFDHLRRLIVVDLSDAPQVLVAFEGILAEQSRAAPAGDTMTASLMTQCLVHMFRRLLAEGDHTLSWLMALEDPYLARAIDLVLDDPGSHHSVHSLAEAACMSRSAFAQRFVAAFGRSPMSVVHHLRMQRAVELLQSGVQSVDQVANRVGFSSRSHFSRAFKRHTGVPPSAFQHAARSGGPTLAA